MSEIASIEHRWRPSGEGEPLEENGVCTECGRFASEAGEPCAPDNARAIAEAQERIEEEGRADVADRMLAREMERREDEPTTPRSTRLSRRTCRTSMQTGKRRAWLASLTPSRTSKVSPTLAPRPMRKGGR
jgi:hypothetical protein